MFTVQELVDQGYTVQHARRFIQSQAIHTKVEKQSLKARKEAIKPLAAKSEPDPKATYDAQQEAIANGAFDKPTSLRERMIATQEKSRRKAGSQRDRAEKLASIRAWAKSAGFKVSDYGQIPKAAVEAFHAYHGTQAS